MHALQQLLKQLLKPLAYNDYLLGRVLASATLGGPLSFSSLLLLLLSPSPSPSPLPDWSLSLTSSSESPLGKSPEGNRVFGGDLRFSNPIDEPLSWVLGAWSPVGDVGIGRPEGICVAFEAASGASKGGLEGPSLSSLFELLGTLGCLFSARECIEAPCSWGAISYQAPRDK